MGSNFYNGYHSDSKNVDNPSDIMGLVVKLVEKELCPNYAKRIQNLLWDMKAKTDDEKRELETAIENEGRKVHEINDEKRRVEELWREKSEECDELKAENRDLLKKLGTFEDELQVLKSESNRSAKQRGIWKQELSGY